MNEEENVASEPITAALAPTLVGEYLQLKAAREQALEVIETIEEKISEIATQLRGIGIHLEPPVPIATVLAPARVEEPNAPSVSSSVSSDGTEDRSTAELRNSGQTYTPPVQGIAPAQVSTVPHIDPTVAGIRKGAGVEAAGDEEAFAESISRMFNSVSKRLG